MKLWRLIGRVGFWLSWPVLWLYLRGTKRTRVIILADGKVLLIKGWLSAGHWMLPGGGIHRRESPLAAAIREVREETGVALDPVQLKTLLTDFKASDYGFSFISTVFVVELPKLADLKVQKWEISQAEWVDASDLHDLSPMTKMLLQHKSRP